jgi:multidrug efflux pump subunit AcrB
LIKISVITRVFTTLATAFHLERKNIFLTPSEIGRQLRGAFFGIEVKRIQRQNSEVTIYVRYPKNKRISIEQIYKSRIRLNNGELTSIRDIAKIEKTRGLGEINRTNGRRVAIVTAMINKDIVSLNDAVSEIKNNIISNISTKHHLLSFNFEGEKKEQDKSMAEINRNIIIALILIYVLLGTSMRSYFQPFIILAAVPFGFFGAVWGHFILGHPLTFISMFGIVALIGVLVNASVVLLDFFNKTVTTKKITIEDASIASIRRRFRPILLTTISTCAGLLPILFETSLQAKFLIPMVISLSIGILFSTFIILFLVPSLLKITDDVNGLFRKRNI